MGKGKGTEARFEHICIRKEFAGHPKLPDVPAAGALYAKRDREKCYFAYRIPVLYKDYNPRFSRSNIIINNIINKKGGI